MDIIEQLKTQDLTDYKSIPFWSWNNELDANGLVKQIEQMKQKGIGGFIMHARTGLTTPYLGEKWFACIEACLDKAKELGMNAWVYDENGWPSGFVGGELLKDEANLATYLEMKENSAVDNVALANYIDINGNFKRVFSDNEVVGAVYSVYLKRSPANTDILNPKVMDQFIGMTYEKYYERFKDRFGKELVGFFTDEPQYFRYATPYSIVLDDEFKAIYNEDILDGLVHLFFDEERDYEFRVKYYKLINAVYTRNFYKRLNDWCNEHGCKLTGHSVEETYLFTQMWGGAGCTPSYEYESIPGIDCLSNRFTSQLAARQLGSAKDQLGIKQGLTETYGCSGYDATPRRLRAIGDGQFVHGVTLMCQHLYPFSLQGQGKMDCPPCFSEHAPWFEEFKDFNDHFTHVGYLQSNSKSMANVVVINPMSSIYLQYKRHDEEKAQIIDKELSNLMGLLKEEGIYYHFVDESLLNKHGSVQEGQLTVGKMQYDYVVIPYAPNLYGTTKTILQEYVKNGGKVYTYANAPIYTDGDADDWSFLKRNTTLKEIRQNGKVNFTSEIPVEYSYRQGDGFEMLYLFNESADSTKVVLENEWVLLNTVTLQKQKVKTFQLGGERSAVLLKGVSSDGVYKEYANVTDLTKALKYRSNSKNSLIVDNVSVSKDGENWGKTRFCYELLDELIKEEYQGKLYVRYAFELDEDMPLTMLKEKDKGGEYTLNGKPLTFTQSQFDIYFEEADLTGKTVKGTNVYQYVVDFYEHPQVKYALYDPQATESVRNCLSFDTEIEPIYIEGDFAVNEELHIIPANKNIKPQNMQEQGLEFFAGSVNFSVEFFAEYESAILKATGDYMAIRLKVNGEEFAIAVTDSVEIPLKQGENNLIELQVVSSLRNKIGPLHTTREESFGVSPEDFAMRGTWNNGKSAGYKPEYKVKPFGIEKLQLYY